MLLSRRGFLKLLGLAPVVVVSLKAGLLHVPEAEAEWVINPIGGYILGEPYQGYQDMRIYGYTIGVGNSPLLEDLALPILERDAASYFPKDEPVIVLRKPGRGSFERWVFHGEQKEIVGETLPVMWTFHAGVISPQQQLRLG